MAPTVLVLDELDSLAPRRDGEGNDKESVAAYAPNMPG